MFDLRSLRNTPYPLRVQQPLPMALVCHHCHRGFSHSGFTFHGLRSSNWKCKEAYNQSVIDQLLADVEEQSDTDAVSDEDDGLAAIIDYSRDDTGAMDVDEPFGIEPDVDWNWRDLQDSPANVDTDPSDIDTDSDADEDDVEHLRQLLDDFEILPLDAEVQLPSAESEIPEAPKAPQLEDEPVQLNDPDTRHDTSVFIEKFTEGRAGAPIENSDIPAHIQYQQKLDRRDNAYSPFDSKIDWEFARWAKTRGISETALNDLLSIEGVGQHFRSVVTRSLTLRYVMFRSKSDSSCPTRTLVN
jgi:hypothetical protein